MGDAARKTSGVCKAMVNFMTRKMLVEFDEDQQPARVMQDVAKAGVDFLPQKSQQRKEPFLLCWLSFICSDQTTFFVCACCIFLSEKLVYFFDFPQLCSAFLSNTQMRCRTLFKSIHILLLFLFQITMIMP